MLLLILAIAAFGIGSAITGGLHKREDISALFSLGIETSLGLGSISILTFFLGILKLLYWWLLWPLLVGAAVYGVISLRTIFSRLRLKFSTSLIYLIPVILVLAMVALIIVDYLAPASRYDDLKYHLSLPRRYAESHRVYPFSTTFHSYWPGNLEMLITDVMMLGTDSGGRGVSLLILLSLAAVVAGLTHQIFPKFPGIVPAILLFTIPTIFSQVQVSSTDLAGSFWMLGAIALLIVWLHNLEQKFCMFAGAFMGFALGAKYNFMYEIAVATLVVIVYGLIFQRPFLTKRNVKAVLLMALIAILVGSPWYIRNWIMTGNPVYPFYYSIFGGTNWSEGLDEEFMVWLKIDYRRPALSEIPSSLLKNNGFYIFYLLPLSLIACRRRKQILVLSLGLLMFFAWYYLSTYQLRFGITWQVLLTMAIAYGLLETTRYWKGTHYIIMLILCGFIVQPLPRYYKSEKPRMKVVLGDQSAEEYLSNMSRLRYTYPLIDYANKNLPDGTILATFWYNAGHYQSRHEYFMLNPLVSGVVDHTAIKSPEEYARAVINTGATHLIYSPAMARLFVFSLKSQSGRYDQLHSWHEYFIRHHTRFIRQNRYTYLYEIVPEGIKDISETIVPSIFNPPEAPKSLK